MLISSHSPVWTRPVSRLRNAERLGRYR